MYARHGPEVRDSVCACDVSQPRRHHWAWDCPVTCGTAPNRPVPRHESEKRLCVPVVLRPDRAQHPLEEGAVPGIRMATQQELAARGRAIIATDGGAMGGSLEERVASFGIAVGSVQRRGEVGGMDNTSYKAEVWALYRLMQSIDHLGGDILVIIDNLAVVREARLRLRGVALAMATPQQFGTLSRP